MRRIQHSLLLLPALALPTAVHAGGLGISGYGGVHNVVVPYYNEEGDQGQDSQYRPSFGGGFEAILGDRDDRIQGVARAIYLQDTAAVDPDTGGTENATYALATAPDHVGIATVGVLWGLLGDPDAFQAHLVTHLGAGIVTLSGETGEASSLEFAIGEAGAGAEYRVARNVEVYFDAVFSMRYRKGFFPGGNGSLGVRYIFD